MSLVLRAFLIWMVALAIPAQGFAAATMLHCGPAHQRQQQAVTLHHGNSAQAAHPGAHHGSLQSPDAQPGADRGAEGSRLFADSEVAQSKCSACAACCIALALLPHMPSFGVIDSMSSGRPGAFAFYTGFVADGPERPPKASLA